LTKTIQRKFLRMILDHVTYIVTSGRPMSERPKAGWLLRHAWRAAGIRAGAACDLPEAANRAADRGPHVS
jgi:hypothetical protein